MKMFTNILYMPKSRKEKVYTSVMVQCIVEELSDANDDAIQQIRNYCLDKNIIFECRRYNSYEYSLDRYYISRLPAFHLFVKNRMNLCGNQYEVSNYERTFYPNTGPIQHVDEGLEIYISNVKQDKKNKEFWDKFSVRNIFGLTSYMENYNKKD